jgi:hypothetical protein
MQICCDIYIVAHVSGLIMYPKIKFSSIKKLVHVNTLNCQFSAGHFHNHWFMWNSRYCEMDVITDKSVYHTHVTLLHKGLFVCSKDPSTVYISMLQQLLYFSYELRWMLGNSAVYQAARPRFLVAVLQVNPRAVNVEFILDNMTLNQSNFVSPLSVIFHKRYLGRIIYHSPWNVCISLSSLHIRRCIQKFPDWVVTKYTLITINTRWKATQRVMAAKLTRLTHKIATQLRLMAERYIICSSRFRQPVRKFLDTPS